MLTLAQPGTVTLSLYDLNGRKVGDLVAGEQRAPGRHTVSLNARNMASGTYLYILEAASSGKTYREARRMTLIK